MKDLSSEDMLSALSQLAIQELQTDADDAHVAAEVGVALDRLSGHASAWRDVALCLGTPLPRVLCAALNALWPGFADGVAIDGAAD